MEHRSVLIKETKVTTVTSKKVTNVAQEGYAIQLRQPSLSLPASTRPDREDRRMNRNRLWKSPLHLSLSPIRRKRSTAG